MKNPRELPEILPETLIGKLSSEAGQMGKHTTLSTLFAVWAIGFAIYIGIVFLSGILLVRPDFIAMLTHPLFAAEIAVLVAMVLSTALAAATLAFPDQYQKPHLLVLPPIAFALLVLVLIAAFILNPEMTGTGWEGAGCLLCISELSLPPALLMLYKARKMASTQPGKTGVLCLLCAFSIGALMLRLSEETNSIAHVVLWHYLPMLAIAALGLWLGKRVLRW